VARVQVEAWRICRRPQGGGPWNLVSHGLESMGEDVLKTCRMTYYNFVGIRTLDCNRAREVGLESGARKWS
jgi:hypothetical protein